MAILTVSRVHAALPTASPWGVGVEDLLAEAAARPLTFRAVRRERGQEHRLQAFGEGQ